MVHRIFANNITFTNGRQINGPAMNVSLTHQSQIKIRLRSEESSFFIIHWNLYALHKLHSISVSSQPSPSFDHFRLENKCRIEAHSVAVHS